MNSQAMKMRGGYRYSSFDAFKAIAALLVVFLHFPFDGVIGGIIGALSRIGVPFFFMVSGFFSYKEGGSVEALRERSKKRIRKYLILIIGINAVYISKHVLKCILGRISLQELLRMFVEPDFLIANFGFDAGFIWFIRALLYIEIIQLLFGKHIISFMKSQTSTVFIVVIWFLDILLMKYSNLIFGFVVPDPWAEILTKFIGTGLLFYMAGMKIKVYEKETEKAVSKRNWLFYILIAVALNVFEFLLLNYFDVNQMPVNYIFTFPSVICIFMYLFTHRSLGEGTVLCFIGENLSMYIYYWHGLLGAFVSGASILIGLPSAFYSNAFVIYFVALVVAIVIYYCKPVVLRQFKLVKK